MVVVVVVVSVGPQKMMWLMFLSPSWPPGSNVLLPFVSAQTVWPAVGLSKIVSTFGSPPPVWPALTMTLL